MSDMTNPEIIVEKVDREAVVRAIRKLIECGYTPPANKRDQCEHGKFGWEDCIACYDIEIEKLADAIERGDHAIAMETGTAMTAGHGPKDDSATRRGSPEGGRASGKEEGVR